MCSIPEPIDDTLFCDECGQMFQIDPPFDTGIYGEYILCEKCRPRPAAGVYCPTHIDKPVMHCPPCKKLWSPCCGETHECP